MDLEFYFSASDMDAINTAPGQKKCSEDILKTLDYGPEISLHAPFMDLSPGAVDEKIRAITMERFEQALDLCGQLGAKTVVFHSGYEKWKYALRVDIWLERSVLTWEPLIKKAQKTGIRIAVENIFEDSPDNLIALFERFSGCAHFGLCFDTGHFNLFSKVPIESWIVPLKKNIIELHLHDNDGSMDAHRPIGDGTFPFAKFFDEFSLKDKEDIVFTLEAHNKEDVFKSLKRLKEF